MKMCLVEELAPRGMVLVESAKSDKNPNILGTMYGPCADYKNPTRNGNFYSRKLWENAFKDDIVKESLEDRILLGELDHPDSRLETKATNACIVMTDYEFHDDEGLLYGKFDILPTPNGRILKSLLDCNCKLGVSSRGEADVVENSEGINVVDEDGYNFIAFDAVALPAVKAAKPHLSESLQKVKSLKESIASEIENAETSNELSMIKNIIENINIPDTDSLMESVNNKLSQLNEESTRSSSKLLKDLEVSTNRITELEGMVSRLKSSFITSKKDINQRNQDNEKLISESKLLKKNVNDLSFKLTESRNQYSDALDQYDQLKESYNEQSIKISSLESQIKDLKSELSNSQDKYEVKIKNLKESMTTQYQKKLDESIQSSNKFSKSLNKMNCQYKELSESYKKIENQYSSLLESYILTRSKSLGLNSNEVKSMVKSSSTVNQVDKIIESLIDRKDRYNSLPFTTPVNISSKSKITLSANNDEENEEEKNSRQFMESVNKLF